MTDDRDELNITKDLIKLIKPKLFLPIWTTFICAGPPLNLFFRHYLEDDIKNPTTVIIMTIIAMTWLILVWYWYAKGKKEYKMYEKKIPIAIHYLISQEKSYITDELNKLNDIADTISSKELLKKVKIILDNIKLDKNL